MPPQGRGCGPDLNKSRVDLLNQIDATVAGLNRLARNLWWTWNQDAQDVFEELSPRAWRYLYHNAVAVLRELSDEELRVRLLGEEFNGRVQEVLRQFDAYLGATGTWAGSMRPAWPGGRWRISARSLAFTRRCRSRPVAWACWPATTPSRPATLALALSASACFTARDIFSRQSVPRTGRRSITASLTRRIFRSSRCWMTTASRWLHGGDRGRAGVFSRLGG